MKDEIASLQRAQIKPRCQIKATTIFWKKILVKSKKCAYCILHSAIHFTPTDLLETQETQRSIYCLILYFQLSCLNQKPGNTPSTLPDTQPGQGQGVQNPTLQTTLSFCLDVSHHPCTGDVLSSEREDAVASHTACPDHYNACSWGAVGLSRSHCMLAVCMPWLHNHFALQSHVCKYRDFESLKTGLVICSPVILPKGQKKKKSPLRFKVSKFTADIFAYTFFPALKPPAQLPAGEDKQLHFKPDSMTNMTL